MATRGRVGMVQPDGSVISVYLHWDNYPSGSGRILLNHYTDAEKVKELISLGSISSLAPNINPDPKKGKHTFDNPQDDVVVAYGRDRGENPEDIKPRVDKTVDDFVKSDVEEYGYLFKDGSWFIIKGYADKRKLIPFTAKIITADDNGDEWWV